MSTRIKYWTVEVWPPYEYYKAHPRTLADLRAALAEVKFLGGDEMIDLSDDGELTITVKR